MTSFLRRHARDILDGVKHLWWVFVIVMPLNGYGTFLAIDHANANAARQERHTNQQFRQALILANHKFQQSIRISTNQSAYSINKSACGFRALLGKARLRSQAALDDPNTPAAAKAAARQALSDIAAFLETQVTVPSDFPCSKLPKHLPKAHP